MFLRWLNIRRVLTPSYYASISDAAEIAFDQMLQEDFSHPLTKALCWYACHLYWKNPPEIIDEVEEEEEEVSTFITQAVSCAVDSSELQ